MNTYQKNSHEEVRPNLNTSAEEGLKIDGLQQVVEMLKYADPAFRESLLRRLMQRDPKLAQSLRKVVR